MIVLIDNYDSFTYNLYHQIGAALQEADAGRAADIHVIRNDAMTARQVIALEPSSIVLSPGPGRPEAAGVSMELVRYAAARIPVLGVCLGHQAICEVFGATVSYAKELMHGKSSTIELDTSCPLFEGLPDRIQAGRYHSLAALSDTLPESLRVTARAEDGEIMAVAHRDYPIFGVQFHPESILTPDGGRIMRNFLRNC